MEKGRFCFWRLMLLPLLLVMQHGAAQDRGKVRLLDAATLKPIQYATLKVAGKPLGTYADSTGTFLQIGTRGDTLQVTAIGYAAHYVVLPVDTILLQRQEKMLPNVVLNTGAPSVTWLSGITTLPDFNWGTCGLGEEFAQLIDLQSDSGSWVRIRRVELAVGKYTPAVPILLHVYAVDPSTGLPGKELLDTPILVQRLDYKRGRIVVDLSTHQVVTTDMKVFVGFQWMHVEKMKRLDPLRSTLLSMTTKVPEVRTYSRALTLASYHWFPALAPKGKVANTMFSVLLERM